jgi:orotidine-5'-phosphate decarboxylase
MLMKPETRLILALDVTDRDWALDIVEAVRGDVDAIKINWPLVLNCGPDMVDEISAIKPVICDFKIADIPNTSRLIAENAFERGASGVIIHAFSGIDSLETVVGIAREYDGLVFSVVELSHPGAVESYAGVLDRNIDISMRARVSGFIAPGTRPDKIEHIRRLAGPKATILSPGIGAQGGSGKIAIESGADFVIVGRSIYTAEDPGAVARDIVATLR